MVLQANSQSELLKEELENGCFAGPGLTVFVLMIRGSQALVLFLHCIFIYNNFIPRPQLNTWHKYHSLHRNLLEVSPPGYYLHTMAIYYQMAMDSAEDVEKYVPDGFHPIVIKQLLGNGRYKVLHKLGSGGLATVWLARDLHYDPQKSTIGPLVSLKVQRANESPESADESPEVMIPRKLATLKPDLGSQLALPEHAFLEQGPNGTHLCVVSELAGSNLSAITESIGRMSGTRRLRGDIARKLVSQVVHFVYEMHSAGFVHGGIMWNMSIVASL